MENATKALLSAAAVLIVIVLIAIGILLLKDSSSTAKQSETVGKEIGLATDEAIRDYQKVYISKEEFNDFLNYIAPGVAKEFTDIILQKNKKIRNQLEISGYVYYKNEGKSYYSEYRNNLDIKLNKPETFESTEDSANYRINKVLPKMIQDKKVQPLPALNGGWDSYILYLSKCYALKKKYIKNDNEWNNLEKAKQEKIENECKNSKGIVGAEVFWNYASDGYIDKVVFVLN